MLFAVLDYINYRRQQGIYSVDSIQAQGAMLATRDNFADLSMLRPGDVFWLHTRISTISWLVMYYTHSPWSHTGCFIGPGDIVDATTGGVTKHHFYDYCDGRSYALIKILAVDTDEQRERMKKYLLSAIGNGFNWAGIFRLFFEILFARHESYRVVYSLDVTISFLFLTGVGALWYRTVFWFGISLLLSCIAIVLWNLVVFRRRHHSRVNVG